MNVIHATKASLIEPIEVYWQRHRIQNPSSHITLYDFGCPDCEKVCCFCWYNQKEDKIMRGTRRLYLKRMSTTSTTRER